MNSATLARQDGPGPRQEDPGERRTILVVDDEVLIRFAIADYLRSCGYQVLEAANAAEATVLLESVDTRIDLVLADIRMPGEMDGFRLARWIRSRWPDIEIILTSSVVRSSEIADELCGLGPVEAKPYEQAELLRRIQLLLGRSGRGHPESRS